MRRFLFSLTLVTMPACAWAQYAPFQPPGGLAPATVVGSQTLAQMLTDIAAAQSGIGAAQSGLTAETSRATNAETTLQGNINAEATTRANTDATLTSAVDTKIGAVVGGQYDYQIPTIGVSKASMVPWIRYLDDSGATQSLFLQEHGDYATTAFVRQEIATGYTVSTLPTDARRYTGARAYVTDATACTFLGSLTAGGSMFCPVVFNGSSWVAE
ncbi:MAG: hypothetical protein ABF893_15560 [Gluconacetobacter liquefaciens]